MKKIPAYFVLTVIVALIVLFAARQRTLLALRSENDALREQAEQKTPPPAQRERADSTEGAARLTDAEEKELLQLRSRIGPLRDQLREMSNRVGLLQRSRSKAVPVNSTAGK